MAGEWVPSAAARPMIRRMESTRDDLDRIRWANNVPFWAVHVAAGEGSAAAVMINERLCNGD